MPPVFDLAPAGIREPPVRSGSVDPASVPRYAPGPCRTAATSEECQVLTAPDPRETSPA